jgi:Flp pilus assembly secretin CpaC
MTHDTGNLQDKIRFVTGSRRIRIRSSNSQIELSGVAGNALAGERVVAVCERPGSAALKGCRRWTDEMHQAAPASGGGTASRRSSRAIPWSYNASTICLSTFATAAHNDESETPIRRTLFRSGN